MSETRRASWRSENASELHGAYMAPMKRPCGAARISRSQLDAAMIDLRSHLTTTTRRSERRLTSTRRSSTTKQPLLLTQTSFWLFTAIQVCPRNSIQYHTIAYTIPHALRDRGVGACRSRRAAGWREGGAVAGRAVWREY